jgi:hypothetical protein
MSTSITLVVAYYVVAIHYDKVVLTESFSPQ